MAGAKPPDPLELANELRPVWLRVARELRRESHAFGLTASQVTLLATIREHPGIGVRKLATLEGVSAPNISTQVRRLERAGLVTREQLADGRRVGLHVTPEALGVIQSVRSRRTAWLAERLRRLDGAELTAIEATLEPLRRLLEDDPPDPG
ncbi:MAG TPA: MarR family transcriptional regulator [Gaiellaceae bacterium]|jgi:DNA-binding MarR family transcriptional regulator|nr:MarR family transcriptional regulator [Gaiellaceae bacterium]